MPSWKNCLQKKRPSLDQAGAQVYNCCILMKKQSFTVSAFWSLPQLHWLKKEFDSLSREAVACNGESSTLNGASFSHWSTVQKFYWITSFHRTMSIHQRCLILTALCNIVFGDYSASNPSRPSQLHFHHWDSHMQTMICGHRFDSRHCQQTSRPSQFSETMCNCKCKGDQYWQW